MTISSLEEFDKLRALKQQIYEISNFHISSLSLFHLSGNLIGTETKPVSVTGFTNLLPDHTQQQEPKKVSIASTATCLRSLYNCPAFRFEGSLDCSNLFKEL